MSNKIIIIWVLFIIFLLSIIYLSGNYYLENEDYINLKQEYKSDVKSYLDENNLYPEYKITIDSDTLINEGFIDELIIKAKKCRAEAVVTKIIFFYVYDIRLTCK